MKFSILKAEIFHRLKSCKIFLIVFLSLAAALIPGMRASAASTGDPGDFITSGDLTVQNGEISGLISANTDIYTYKVPIYISSQVFSTNFGWYLAGLIVFNNPFTYKCAGNDILPNYFEAATDLNAVYVSGQFRINFSGQFVQSYPILIGYMVFNIPVSQSNQSFIITPGQITLSSNQITFRLWKSTSYQNMVENFAASIDSSSDVDHILDYLYIIKNNAPLINDVLSELEGQTSILNAISSRLGQIYSTDVNLYNLLYNYINNSNSGASTASQAASNLAGAAADQKAAEASLAALSPGNMSDLDSADGLAVLDNVTNATRFWSTLVTQFSEVSGILWGFFIIALLLGLIAFILRLR